MDLPDSANVTTCFLAAQSLSTSASSTLRPPPRTREVTYSAPVAIRWVAG